MVLGMDRKPLLIDKGVTGLLGHVWFVRLLVWIGDLGYLFIFQ